MRLNGICVKGISGLSIKIWSFHSLRPCPEDKVLMIFDKILNLGTGS